MGYLDAFLREHGEPTELPQAPSGSSVSAPHANGPASAVEQGLAGREVRGFRASLLASLPRASALVLDMPGRGRVTVATHADYQGADLDVSEWNKWCLTCSEPTVADVLKSRGATLRLVVINGDEP